MASNQSQGNGRQHNVRCRGKQRMRRYPWTIAELRILQNKGGLGCSWIEVSKSFTINGVNRHNSLDCFKKWCELFRDTKLKAPQVKREEDSNL